MTETIQLYEGRVAHIEDINRAKRWRLVTVPKMGKPLAIDINAFTGVFPNIGDRISVQAKEGSYWYFAEHRSLVIKKGPEPRADYITAPISLIQELERYVLDELDSLEQVSSDDVHDGIMERVGDGGYSPKIVGMVFGSLARKHVIHKVGRIKTKRPQAHAREITVWERTRK